MTAEWTAAGNISPGSKTLSFHLDTNCQIRKRRMRRPLQVKCSPDLLSVLSDLQKNLGCGKVMAQQLRLLILTMIIRASQSPCKTGDAMHRGGAVMAVSTLPARREHEIKISAISGTINSIK
jgi:hypothetical protein